MASGSIGDAATSDLPTTATVGTDGIYQSIKVTYDETRQDLLLQDTFRRDGMLGLSVKLVAPSKLVADGKLVPQSNHWWGTANYQLTQAGPFKANHVFEWTAPNGHVYRNEVLLRRAALTGTITISKSKGGRITWTGEALQPGERIEIELQNTGGKAPVDSMAIAAVEASDAGAGYDVTFSPEDMKKMIVGPANAYVSRSSGGDLQDATDTGGRWFGLFMSKFVKIKITQ
jgi:hypothetical protein